MYDDKELSTMSSATATLDKQTWMSQVLDIDQLKLTDIVWPGTHNSGMDKKAPNYEVVLGHWTTCQNDSFAWQLDNGARAFDIRLGCTAGPQRPLYAGGARLVSAYPVVPLARGQALTIGVTSYDGGLYYGLWADRDAMPDLAVLGQCLEDALAELLETV